MELWPVPREVRWGRDTLPPGGVLSVEVGGTADWLRDAAEDVIAALSTRLPCRVRRVARGGEAGPARLLLCDAAFHSRLAGGTAAHGCGEGQTPANAGEGGCARHDAAGRTANGSRRQSFDSRGARGPAPVRAAEGYALRVGPQGVLLSAADRRGAFYGALTLAQMAQGGALPSAEIRDWPRCPVRGVHMYLPAWKDFDFFVRFLDFMAERRYNTLFLEIGGGMEFRRHPEINRAWAAFCREALAYDPAKDRRGPWRRPTPSAAHPRGPVALQVSRFFPKDSTHTELAGGKWLTYPQLRRLIAECAKRHIEIVPEVQSLSHSYYLCMAHPEIAERPRREDPWPDTYCPSNPRSYELLFDVMEEVIGLFKPRTIHIGHDEAYTFRRCARCRRKSGHEVLAEDVLRIHDFLSARGVRTMMWGDKFMVIRGKDGRRYGGILRRFRNPRTGEVYVQPATHKSAARMPADLLIMDWYWSLDPASAGQFHRYGFEVVYGNFSPFSFAGWERRSRPPWVKGAEVSSWCGVTPYEFGHNRVLADAFAAAGMLWTGVASRPEVLRHRMARELPAIVDRLAGAPRRLVSGGPGMLHTVDLDAHLAPLPEDVAGRVRVGPVLPMPREGEGLGVVSRRGRLAAALILSKSGSATARIEVGARARALVLVHAATMEGVFHQPTYYSYHRPPASLLAVDVEYEDGGAERFDSRYGDDIGRLFGWPTERPWLCHRAVPLLCGEATLYAQEWRNPRPARRIRALTLRLGPDATERGAVIVAAIGKVT